MVSLQGTNMKRFNSLKEMGDFFDPLKVEKFEVSKEELEWYVGQISKPIAAARRFVSAIPSLNEGKWFFRGIELYAK